MTEQAEQAKSTAHRAKVGTVVTVSGAKTIKVQVMTLVKHKMYGKYIRRRSHYAVHDPDNTAQVGDQVEIVPCRRISKSKSWRLNRVVRPAQVRE
jgi:small subunit ribosomal protein S17